MWVDFTATTTYIAMPLATAITSRTGGRSLAMALSTQNFVGHCLLPPVSPHEDMGRDAISTTRLMSRAGLRGALPMSALPPKADMCGATRDVCFGPIADIMNWQPLAKF